MTISYVCLVSNALNVPEVESKIVLAVGSSEPVDVKSNIFLEWCEGRLLDLLIDGNVSHLAYSVFGGPVSDPGPFCANGQIVSVY